MDRETVGRYFSYLDTNDYDALDKVLKNEFDINDRLPFGGASFLSYSASGRNIDVCAYLLERGADASGLGYMNWTALIMAAGNCDLEIVTLLLDNGADVSYRTKDTGVSAIHWAAEQDSTGETTELLIKHGADPNACTLSGLDDEPVTKIFEGSYPEGQMRPLHFAFMKDTPALGAIKTLLKHNADPNLRTVSKRLDIEVEDGEHVKYKAHQGKSALELMAEHDIAINH